MYTILLLRIINTHKTERIHKITKSMIYWKTKSELHNIQLMNCLTLIFLLIFYWFYTLPIFSTRSYAAEYFRNKLKIQSCILYLKICVFISLSMRNTNTVPTVCSIIIAVILLKPLNSTENFNEASSRFVWFILR